MTAVRIIVGALLGGGLAFGSYYAVPLAAGEREAALWTGVVLGGVGLIYGIVANVMSAYKKVGSWFGFVLDVTWSMLNTIAGLLVWLPACAASGKRISPTGGSDGTGCLVYDKNPRGGGYAATTIGTVIGGGYDSHEATHVWQARLFGPVYMPIYGLAWLFNLLGLLVTGKTKDISRAAYRRIVWEDWAYMGESSTGKWVGGLFLALLYVGLMAMIPIGIAVGAWWLWPAGALGLLAYTIIRAAMS